MGKVYTALGVSFNIAGTTVASGNNVYWGTSADPAFIGFTQNGVGTLVIESLGKSIQINVDDGFLSLNANSGTVSINMGTALASKVRFGGGNGTIAELDGGGNLKLAGTIGTGITF